jgi:hypothetical protein
MKNCKNEQPSSTISTLSHLRSFGKIAAYVHTEQIKGCAEEQTADAPTLSFFSCKQSTTMIIAQLTKKQER